MPDPISTAMLAAFVQPLLDGLAYALVAHTSAEGNFSPKGDAAETERVLKIASNKLWAAAEARMQAEFKDNECASTLQTHTLVARALCEEFLAHTESVAAWNLPTSL